ncbi:MAG: glycine zipper 2TM domain-containing protein [Rhodoferax sp.]|uniref:glycine zipper 2TM domain-containing protein n=1 Tax=Rhodoferax sp. TaxID=50421 RepID=UPI003264A660
MNTPPNTVAATRLHPMILLACGAIVLVCALGAAAMMGWLPSSSARNTDASTTAVTTPVPEPVVTAPVRAVAPPVKHLASNETQNQNAPVAPICSNCGVVESAREITTAAKGSGVGAVGGAVVGGVLGHQVGGGRGKDLMTVLGAVGGAVAGNHIEGQVKATHSYEIVVRLDDGSTRTVHQADPAGVNPGDRVKIVNGVVRLNS